ncbi:hypothetical protein Glo7428_1762 [Gloeocapsa sp. PCC 7428]|uniref:hypothetical protein n=1 Tax=Gloeocapsa sp. PCC 7428 TaxID=1173026 RepID=UPI0002A5F16E|nr:hypothetical protein [Gloeocapsa sp. PCC 7428]AFZ30317.1 hypothetical protein Glo7428_1762 [Gloeocapsa sp. PCC 7428]
MSFIHRLAISWLTPEIGSIRLAQTTTAHPQTILFEGKHVICANGDRNHVKQPMLLTSFVVWVLYHFTLKLLQLGSFRSLRRAGGRLRAEVSSVEQTDCRVYPVEATGVGRGEMICRFYLVKWYYRLAKWVKYSHHTAITSATCHYL